MSTLSFSTSLQSLWKFFYRATASNETHRIARESRLTVFRSVRPSLKRVDCDETKESSVDILVPHERSVILGFWQEERLVAGNPFYLKFWVKLISLERKR